MWLFLALISKTKFLGLILKKVLCSCFTVNCIVVKSMKQYQGIIKDGEFFNMFKGNVEKYAAPWRGLQCDPCQSG